MIFIICVFLNDCMLNTDNGTKRSIKASDARYKLIYVQVIAISAIFGNQRLTII